MNLPKYEGLKLFSREFVALGLIFCFIADLFLLFAFMKSNVDMGAYLYFYDNINSLGDIWITDPGFGLLMYTGKL